MILLVSSPLRSLSRNRCGEAPGRHVRLLLARPTSHHTRYFDEAALVFEQTSINLLTSGAAPCHKTLPLAATLPPTSHVLGSHDVAAQAPLDLQGVLTEPGRQGGFSIVAFSIIASAEVGCSFIIAHNRTVASSVRM